MKKWGVLILAMVLMVVSVGLVGCGGGKKETTETAKPAARQESLDDLLAKSRNLPGLTYDYVISAQEGQITGKMWVADKKMKIETSIQNQKMITIIDEGEKVMHTYMPAQNMAMKIAFNPEKGAKSPNQYSAEIDTTKTKVLERVTYEGVSCKVLQIQDADGTARTKMWVREDYGLPVRVETNEPGGNKTVVEYKNLQVGPVSAGTFQLPAGVTITDMSEMMNNLSPQS